MGVLFSQSEEFVSNDNAKYSFEGPKTNRIPQAEQLPRMPVSTQAPNQLRNQPTNIMMQNSNIRPRSVDQSQFVNAKKPINMPMNSQTRSTNIGQHTNTQGPNTIIRPGVGPQSARPVVRSGANSAMPNPFLSQRSVQNSASPRPIGSPTNQIGRTQSTPDRRCPKCGKTLMPNETVCSICSKNMNK